MLAFDPRTGELGGAIAVVAGEALPRRIELCGSRGGFYVTYKGEYYNNKSSRAAADPVRVQWEQLVDDIDFPLGQSTGAIEGRVIEQQTSAPVADAVVEVFATLSGEWGALWAAAYTGADGTYRIEGLPACSSYRAGVFFPGADRNLVTEYYRNKTSATADPIAVNAGQTTSGIEFDLPPGGIIMGQVTRRDTGAALADVLVNAIDQAQGTYGYTWTAADGSYRMAGLAPGSYAVYVYDIAWEFVNLYFQNQLTLSQADIVAVIAGDNPPAGQRNINFALPVGGAISGTIRQDPPGQPCAGWWVTAVNQGGSYYSRFAEAAADGGYRVAGLPTGIYQVIVSQIPAFETDVRVTAPNETTGIDFHTCPEQQGVGEIRGRITRQDTGAGLQGMTVQALAFEGGYDSATTCTDSSGFYRICNLYPGSYQVRVTAPGERWTAEYYPDAIERLDSSLVDISAGQTVTGISMALRAGGSVCGRVYDEQTGAAVSGALVTIDYDTTTPLQSGETVTQQDGRYCCEALESGGLPDRLYVVRVGHTSCWRDDDQPTTTPLPATPTPTATPRPGTPTATPTITVTPHGTVPPTSTPTDCQETGVALWMPSYYYQPGDPCSLEATVCNSSSGALDGYPLFVILDVFGSYFFGPGFTQTLDNYLASHHSFPPGATRITIIPQFSWPDGAGRASGIVFYSALTDPAMTRLEGSLGQAEFGWGEP